MFPLILILCFLERAEKSGVNVTVSIHKKKTIARTVSDVGIANIT